jgi:hypothetical protein
MNNPQQEKGHRGGICDSASYKRGEHRAGRKRLPLTNTNAGGEHPGLQGYPVRWDKTPEACRVKVRHRRAYEGRPQERAEGAHVKPPISAEGELKREINWRVWTA